MKESCSLPRPCCIKTSLFSVHLTSTYLFDTLSTVFSVGYISWSHDDVVEFDSISAVHFHFFFFIIATQKARSSIGYYSVPIAVIHVFTGNSSAWPWSVGLLDTSSQSFPEFVCQND